MSLSIVQYYGEQISKCGYCTGTECSKSHGMNAYRLDCEDYQELIDRGWRRCGNYCYKPQNDITCCPCYTIKCDALQFKLTKSNKRILRRMNKFLRDGKRETSGSNENGDGEGDGDDIGVGVNASEPHMPAYPHMPDNQPLALNIDQVETLTQAHAEQLKDLNNLQGMESTSIDEQSVSSLASNKSMASNSNPPRKKAKQMRLERRQAKLGQTQLELPQTKALKQEKSLQEFLAAPCESDKHQLKLRLVSVNGEEFRRTLPQSYDLYKKYQIVIHNDPPKHQKAYQDHLQQSPMKHQKDDSGPEMGYGSFHQQYWLDDKLIAVGVIDILPRSVSSVYFFYDPDYSFLSLGTYGSLREIDLVQTIAERVPALKYYYMGFYIQSCPKMRYKGKLAASYLLCPETYIWMLLNDAIRARLDENKYQRLNSDAAARDVNEFLDEHLNDVMLLLNSKSFSTYKRFRQLTGSDGDRNVIMEYGKLVGKVCAHRMLYVNMFST